MPFLIDGHNLIPKVHGLSLKSLDDEEELIHLLQVYGRVHRVKIEVYFDRGAPGNSGVKKYGTVTAHFVPEYSIADHAIIRRLHQLKKSARQWTVVTSDRQIVAEARSVGAAVISSDEFAINIQEAKAKDCSTTPEDDVILSEAEVNEWLDIFSSDEN